MQIYAEFLIYSTHTTMDQYTLILPWNKYFNLLASTQNADLENLKIFHAFTWCLLGRHITDNLDPGRVQTFATSRIEGKKYSKKKRNPHYVLFLVSCTHQHTFSLTSIFGMLSHYSSESQLRELLRLAPPIGISQTMDDLGFSWGYLSWGGGADHNLHDHVVQMFIQEDDLKWSEKCLGLF